MLKSLFIYKDSARTQLADIIERRAPTPCKVVHGYVPPALSGGMYVRNGPGVFRSQEPLDGRGVLVSVSFSEQTSYRSRAIETGEANMYRRWGAFGSVPLKLSKDALFQLSDTSNTSVIALDDAMMTCFDGGLPRFVSSTTLETLPHVLRAPGLSEGLPVKAHGSLFGHVLCAHPCATAQKESDTTVLAFFGCRYFARFPEGIATELSFYETDAAANHRALHRTAVMEVPGILYAHDFIVTRKFYILFDHRLKMNVWQLLIGKGITGALCSCEQTSGHIHIVRRRGSSQTSAITLPECLAPGFVYHHVGHREREDGSVVISSLVYPRYYTLRASEKDSHIPLCRLVNTWIDASSANATQTIVTDGVRWEFSTPLSSAGHFFCLSSAHADRPFHQLIYVNVDTGHVIAYWDASDPLQEKEITIFLGEPVQDHTGQYLMCTCHHNHSSTIASSCYLLIFEAADIAKGPICKLLLPDALPMGLHGCWVGGSRGHNL